jgi:predicted dehydrogenase
MPGVEGHLVTHCDIGLVGCGRWGRKILRDLVALGCRVVVAEAQAAAREYALDAGAALAVPEQGGLPEVAGIVIATPTSSHTAVVECALQRGVPVFVEKPLTDSPASADRLVQLASQRLFVMDKWRYHRGVEALAAIARSGELGPVLGLRTARLQWGELHADMDTVWTLAPHDLSIALEVLGTIPALRGAVCEQLGGRMVGLTGVFGRTPWLAIEVSSRSLVYRREIALHCCDGVVVLAEDGTAQLRVARTGSAAAGLSSTPELRPYYDEPPLRRELEAFLAHLRGGPPPRSSAHDGARIVHAIAELRARALT